MEGKKAKILLCEDDQNLGMVLKNYLELNDFDVTLERDGRLGLAAFQREKFDLCLLDIMFICGNDAVAKKTTTAILEVFGWEVEDMGPAEAARAIEPLCILWCIPGFIRNEWQHESRWQR